MSSMDAIYGIDFGTSTTFLTRYNGESGPEVLWLSNEQPALDSNAFRIGISNSEDSDLATDSLKNRITKKVNVLSSLESKNDSAESDARLIDEVTNLLSEVLRVGKEKHGIKDFESQRVRFGCPAFWNMNQRWILHSAIKKAGFKQVTLVDIKDEAVATGIRYLDLLKGVEDVGSLKNQKILVFDMGGGTLDLALLHVSSEGVMDNPSFSISVLASDSNSSAGDAVDFRVACLIYRKLITNQIPFDTKLYKLGDSAVSTSALLMREAKKVKEALSITLDTPVLAPGAKTEIRITRAEFESEIAPEIAEAHKLVDKLLIQAALRRPPKALLTQKYLRLGVSATEIEKAISDNLDMMVERVQVSELRSNLSDLKSDVDSVILGGGMSRIPAIQQELAKTFQRAEIVNVEADAKFGLVAIDQLVASGLVPSFTPTSINAARPPFEIRLSWVDALGKKGSQTIFPAYEELLIWDESLNQDHMLGKQFQFKLESADSESSGKIMFVRPDNEPISVVISETMKNTNLAAYLENSPVISVTLGRNPLIVKMYSSGLIYLRDSSGSEWIFKTEWPEDWSGLGPRAKNLTLSLEKIKILKLKYAQVDAWRLK